MSKEKNPIVSKEEVERDGNRILNRILIAGKKVGYTEVRLNEQGEHISTFALGSGWKEAQQRFRNPLPAEEEQPFMKPAAAHSTSRQKVRRQGQTTQNGRRGGKRDRKNLVELQPGQIVIGFIARTMAEKGYSFFGILAIERVGEDPEEIPIGTRPNLFVHDSKVPRDLVNDLDETNDQTYRIRVEKCLKGIEGKVLGLDDTIEVQAHEDAREAA